MNIYLEYKTFIFYQLEMNHRIFIRQKMWDQTLQKWIKFCDKIRMINLNCISRFHQQPKQFVETLQLLCISGRVPWS